MLSLEFLQELESLTEKAQAISGAFIRDHAEQSENGRMFVTVPDGRKIEDITEKLLGMRADPRYRSGTVTLTSIASFSHFLVRMAEPHTVLFANNQKHTLTAIFDFHDPVNLPADAPPDPSVKAKPISMARWGRFRAHFAFPVSRPWRAWSGSNKTPMSQDGLANFIEENIADVADPELAAHDPRLGAIAGELGLRIGTRAQLLAAARGLDLHSTEKVKQIVNTTTGETQVLYEQTHEAREADLVVPSAFLLTIPVFEGDANYLLLVRLRHRKIEQSVKWAYDIYTIDRAIDDAFKSACEVVAETANVPLFYGEVPSPQEPR